MNPLSIYRQKEDFEKLDSDSKLAIVEGNANKISLYQKSILELKIKKQ